MEIFLPIRGIEHYGISNYGNVKNLKTNKILKTQKYGKYMTVSLAVKKNKKKLFKLHRLVAETFLFKCNSNYQVDHIDRNTTNNNLKNLRWVSSSDNNINKLNKNKYKKNIYLNNIKGVLYWKILVRNAKLKMNKSYPQTLYSLKNVIDIRNSHYLKHGIPILD